MLKTFQWLGVNVFPSDVLGSSEGNFLFLFLFQKRSIPQLLFISILTAPLEILNTSFLQEEKLPRVFKKKNYCLKRFEIFEDSSSMTFPKQQQQQKQQHRFIVVKRETKRCLISVEKQFVFIS